MDTSLSHSLVRLGAQELFSVAASRGQSLAVFQGRLWITQYGDPKDHVVASGETFAFDRPGLALVEALDASTFAVLTETAAPEAIGYEAAWPQIEPAQARIGSFEVHQRARTMRLQMQGKAARSIMTAARKLFASVGTAAPQRQAA